MARIGSDFEMFACHIIEKSSVAVSTAFGAFEKIHRIDQQLSALSLDLVAIELLKSSK